MEEESGNIQGLQHNGSQFSIDCGSVPADQSENAERDPRSMRRVQPIPIQKQEQMRQQTIEKGMQVVPRQDLPFVK